jgi:hypothetical protein
MPRPDIPQFNAAAILGPDGVRAVNRAVTHVRPGGLAVAEGVSIQDGNGSGPQVRRAPDVDMSGFRVDRRTGLLAPDRRRVTGAIDIVRLTDFGGDGGRSDFADTEMDLNLIAIGDEHGIEIAHIIPGHNHRFATENTGWQTWQALVNKDHRRRTRVGYVNTNSRYSPGDNRSWTGKDNGREFVYTQLDNTLGQDIHLLTVNRGSNLSYVKPHLRGAVELDGHRIDQFLSRGPLVEVLFDVLSGSDRFIAGDLDVDSIPKPRRGAVVGVDGTNNIKSNLIVEDVLTEPGIATSPYLEVSVDGGKPVIAKNGLVKGLVEIGQGNLVVRGGSSGYLDTRLPDGNNQVEVQAMFASAVDAAYHDGAVTDESYVTITPIAHASREVIEQADRNYFLEQREAAAKRRVVPSRAR